MSVTSAVTVPSNSTSNQTQIAETHSIPDADPSMLSTMTRTNNVRRTKNSMQALDKLSDLPYISILIPSPFPHSFSDSL